MKIKLSERERDTVLAALWQWRQEIGFEGLTNTDRGTATMEIAEIGRTGDDAVLLSDEIDALCERLNFRA